MAPLRIRPTIMLFGDSLTQFGWGVDGNVGWVSLLASAYTRRADVLNRGFSGYNTKNCLEILPRIFGDGHALEEPLLFCTVFLGANDAAIPSDGKQHVPIDEYRANLAKIITSIRERVDSETIKVPIILMTPPPVDEPAWAAFQGTEQSNRLNKISSEYGNACKEVAAEYNCPVLDTFNLLGGNENNYSRNLSDGLHLSGSGNTLVFNGLLSLIKDKYLDIAPMEDGEGKYGTSGIPMEEPLWSSFY